MKCSKFFCTLVLGLVLSAASPSWFGTGEANAHLVKPLRGDSAQKHKAAKINLAHARGACKAHTKAGTRTSPRSHCTSLKWLEGLVVRYAPLSFRAYVYRYHPCLAPIIHGETAGTWSPTIYNYAGSGAYGIPQALPGHKMASAGADWKTNPYTQLRWMIGYVNGRYGGECNALARWRAYGWY